MRVFLWLFCSLAASGDSSQTPAKPPVLGPQEALRTFTLPPGFQIECIAAEPHLFNPMSMALDESGRIYASLAHSYRYGEKGSPVSPPTNPVVRLEVGPDGRAVCPTVVVDGFADPVVGIAVRGGKLWATNLNQAFVAPLDDQGHAGPRAVIVRDAETPWNPFGMYRLMFGRDGLVYLSIGDHPTRLQGTDRAVAVRGSTGGVFRFEPDGRRLELLIQGMRAPFTFDIDPFGSLWVLSNGEGNPNRLIRAIRGADYHFQTRPVDWVWLAGRHPLAPPVWENPPGAHTGIVWYNSSNFPGDYWGNLLVANWGVHGYPSANHVILRHVLNERGERIRTEPFLTTTDYRFRPTQIMLAPDGGLYVLDWHGIDDENDLTGRLYKITYTGPRPTPARGLASRNHWQRRQEADRLRSAGPAAIAELGQHASAADPLAAAEALWILRALGGRRAIELLESACSHGDWRVRRLAIQLLEDLEHWSPPMEARLADPDLAVRCEAAAAVPDPARRLRELAALLRHGAAGDSWLRYRAALAFALHADEPQFESLLKDSNADVRLAGLVALDEAFHEGQHGAAARKVLSAFLAKPQQISVVELLAMAERWPHPDLKAPVVKRMSQAAHPEEFARGMAVLRRLGMPLTRQTMGEAAETFLGRLRTRADAWQSPAGKAGVLEILAADRPGPHAVALLAELVRDADPNVRGAAHDVLTTVGCAEPAALDLSWKLALDPAAARQYRLEAIVTVGQLERSLTPDRWQTLLTATEPDVPLVALRCLKNHADRPAAGNLVAGLATKGKDPTFEQDLAFVRAGLAKAGSALPVLDRVPGPSAKPAEPGSKDGLRQRLLERRMEGSAVRGALVFRNQVCYRCHGTVGREAPLGPPLAGVAANNAFEYLVDSLLYPSKIVKTGYMLEIVATLSGELYSGKVAQEGSTLVITTGPQQQLRIAAKDVEARRQENVSLMPEGLEATMSEPELIDLFAYLASLTQPPGATARR